ncbi:MAG TPA: autotransporter-associated beta strand repeat-containing protein [Verrucomicrobiae bacterium]
MKLNRAFVFIAFVFAAIFAGGISAQAANQTWTNAPVDNTWTNVNNWVGLAMPGAINMTGNTTGIDQATFNSPIPGSGIGGAAHPIVSADATVAADRSLEIGGITFDTTNCGAYFFTNNGTIAYPNQGILYVTYTTSANSSNQICLTATETNSETFLEPVDIRLPSSTAGLYNFVNNSPSSSAVLFFQMVSNDSANTRGTVFTFGGSNTGTNSVASLSKGATTTGAMGLTKQGTGTWWLPNFSDLPTQSANNINQGLLILGNSFSLGISASVNINSNGVLQLNGVSLTNTVLNQSGTLLMNGAGTVARVASGAAAGATPILMTSNSADVMTVGVINSAIGGANDSVIHIKGPGTVLLATNSSYIGSWSVDTGVLQIGASVALGTNSVNLNIAAGAVCDATPLGAGATFNPRTPAISGSGTGTTVGSTAAAIKADSAGLVDLATGAKTLNLTYTPASNGGDLTHPSLYISQGTLRMGGNAFTINNASGSPLTAGTYTLIQQASGNVTDGGSYSVIGVTGSGLAIDSTASIVVSGGSVNMVVTTYVPQSLTWIGGNPNGVWDLATTANWLDGGSPSVFHNSDSVLFNSIGSTNPVVTLTGTLAPSSIVMDTTTTNYVFTGSGSIAGSTSLLDEGTGAGTNYLLIQTANSYGGGTTVSNSVLKVGVNNALPSVAGDVALLTNGKLDLNTFSDTINALTGSGTVDNTGGGTSALTIGNNNDSGLFSGVIQNTSGTLAINKNGNGTETLTSSNSYTGATTINSGTLRVANINALGAGQSAVTLNGGVLDMDSSLIVTNLSGTAGTIANNSAVSTNTLYVNSTSTYGGTIVDGSGGGGVAVVLNSGTLTLNSVNTYSGGTYVAAGQTLAIGGAGTAGNGGIILSNAATLAEPTATSTAANYAENMTTLSYAYFTDGELADGISGNFYGSATATNFIMSTAGLSIGAAATEQFSNFLGTIYVTNGSAIRFSATTLSVNGGPNTTFDAEGTIETRNGTTAGIHLGALIGSGTLGSSTGNPGTSTYIIGEKGIDFAFNGLINDGGTGTNNLNLIKAGAGTFTLTGGSVFETNVTLESDGFTLSTNIGYVTNQLDTYIGNTTISNGVLALHGTDNLTNSAVITLASSSAVLDASSMLILSNEFDSDGVTVTNQLLITNGIFEIGTNTLAGMGTLKGILQADSGSTLNVGLPTGTLNITSNAILSGAITMNLNNTNATAGNSQLAAHAFTINPTATLVVTNSGPTLTNGVTYTLFNQGVSGFASLTLPAGYVWQTNLVSSGSITLVSGGQAPAIAVNPSPTNVVFSATANPGSLTLSWPGDHTGWTLQSQTNAPGVGLTATWYDVVGSTTTDQLVVPFIPTDSVFYRMVYTNTP